MKKIPQPAHVPRRLETIKDVAHHACGQNRWSRDILKAGSWPCPTCEGKKKVYGRERPWGGDPCPACAGTGLSTREYWTGVFERARDAYFDRIAAANQRRANIIAALAKLTAEEAAALGWATPARSPAVNSPWMANITYCTAPTSPWAATLKERFDELASLSRGWDGYSGCPVAPDCAQFAANLIERLFVEGVPAPQLVPGGDGTLQIEWHRNQFDVEIDVLAPYDVLAVRRNNRTGEVEELELQMDFSPLREWIAALK